MANASVLLTAPPGPAAPAPDAAARQAGGGTQRLSPPRIPHAAGGPQLQQQPALKMVSLVKLSPTLSLLGHPSDTMQSLHSLHCIGGPVPAEARCGRHKQRYSSSGERLVAG